MLLPFFHWICTYNNGQRWNVCVSKFIFFFLLLLLKKTNHTHTHTSPQLRFHSFPNKQTKVFFPFFHTKSGFFLAYIALFSTREECTTFAPTPFCWVRHTHKKKGTTKQVFFGLVQFFFLFQNNGVKSMSPSPPPPPNARHSNQQYKQSKLCLPDVFLFLFVLFVVDRMSSMLIVIIVVIVGWYCNFTSHGSYS